MKRATTSPMQCWSLVLGSECFYVVGQREQQQPICLIIGIVLVPVIITMW